MTEGNEEVWEIRNELFEEFHQVEKAPLVQVMSTILIDKMKDNQWYAVERIEEFFVHCFTALYESDAHHSELV